MSGADVRLRRRAGGALPEAVAAELTVDPVRLADCLRSDGDGLRLVVPDGVLPDFLIEAYNASLRPEGPARSLDAKQVGLLNRRFEMGRAGGRLALLIRGLMHQRQGDGDTALACYERLVAVEPHALVYNEMATVAQAQGRWRRARTWRSRATALDPANLNLRGALALDRIRAGDAARGFAELAAVVQRPEVPADLHAAWLLYLHYRPDITPAELYAEHRRWARRHAPETVTPPPQRPRRGPLRIGYLSPDFRLHAVAHFLGPILTQHDRRRVRVYGYGNVAHPDAVTARLAGDCDVYRRVYGRDDAEVAEQIRSDGIDILVDCAGHTRGSRLGVLTRRPAPIQVTYLGYPDTTGLDAVDYRLTDAWAEAPGASAWHSETLVPLSGGFNGYRPPAEAPAVSDLPAATWRALTFGSCSAHLKLNRPLIARWSQILAACPGSRLVLRFQGGQDPVIADDLRQRFAERGVSGQRIDVAGWLPYDRHWETYHRIDVVLDTYPYHGTTTSCEALWMGVPVLTLAGGHHAARVGVSLMNRIGLGGFVCHSPAEWVAKARLLHAEPRSLAALRAGLRERLGASTLLDAARFTHGLEAAYETLWQRGPRHG